jgi:4-hydroxybenzoate polyprenyltransferase
MRSAGCIINDISDRNFDKKIERTKFRPIASGKISIKLALFYTSTLCLLALLILINFNFFTIVLAICSIPLAFTYPLMKRFTYWPQLYLGITFNYGIILGWTSINPEIDIKPLVFYFGAIFWTLGYDTIYGFQDIKDDEIIGVKSTSILFKNNSKMFLNIVFFLFVVFYLTMGFLMKFNLAFFILSIIPISHLFLYQIKKFDPLNPDICLSTFKSNNLFGLIIFANLLIGKITF